METQGKHNGYANYETWVVALWMDNDFASYRHFRQLAQDVLVCTRPTAGRTHREAAQGALAEALREEFELASPVRDDSTVYADLMSAALVEVDWYELADGLLRESAEARG